MIPEKYAVYPDDEADHVVQQQQQKPQQEDIGVQGLRLLLDTEALKKDGPASINIIFGIASNRTKGSLSLHATGSTRNQCEEVIAILGKTLAPLIESKMIPCYGLGDQTTQDRNVFSFHMDHSPCHGFEEVLSCFRKMLPNMHFAVFKGSLALIAFGQGEDEIEVCCIWAMREYGLVDSWTQTNIVPLPNVENFFGCTGSGQLVITKSINQLFSFDPDSQNENNLGLEDLAPVEGLLPLEDLAPLVYTPNLIESLVLLNE